MVKKLRFDNLCTCGGYAWNMNGRPKEQPHMPWCPQYEEYAEWFASEGAVAPPERDRHYADSAAQGPVNENCLQERARPARKHRAK